MTTYDEVVARLRAAGCVWAEDEARVLLQTVDAATASSRSDAGVAADGDDDVLNGDVAGGGMAGDGREALLASLLARREAGEPLEHVVGWATFAGVRVVVEPGVFVPRRRSEALVRAARVELSGRRAPVVVDLCCGTGALGCAVVDGLAAYELHAADLDPVACACARRNVEPRGGEVHEGDLLDALPASLLGRVDLLLANAPYVPSGSLDLLPHEARDHEPPLSLDGGADGVEVHRRIAADAARWLAPAGAVLVETSEEQQPATTAAFLAHGFGVETTYDDELEVVVVLAHDR